MSYSLTATPNIDIPANETDVNAFPIMHRYAVGYVVLCYHAPRENEPDIFEFISYGLSVETAINRRAAVDAVFGPLAQKYPECLGYICRVKAEPIAD
jgi:hypothetical protein